MIRGFGPAGVGGPALALVLALAAAACSPAPDDTVPPVTGDERKAAAEARAMIPANELPPEAATPTASESAEQ